MFDVYVWGTQQDILVLNSHSNYTLPAYWQLIQVTLPQWANGNRTIEKADDTLKWKDSEMKRNDSFTPTFWKRRSLPVAMH
ncbi:hypothetical protein TNCV_1494271 [Trichonephila clavipes]|nr:hypothetical protein TNCV_1494271 [Trichonephila clavipes]